MTSTSLRSHRCQQMQLIAESAFYYTGKVGFLDLEEQSERRHTDKCADIQIAFFSFLFMFLNVPVRNGWIPLLCW